MWEKEIQGYLKYCRALGLREQSIRTFEQRLAQLARNVDSGPYEVTQEQLTDFLADQGWHQNTRRSRLQTYRGFWKWAREYSKTDHDPSSGIPKVRALPPSPNPVPYVVYLESLLRSDARTRRVLRLAGENGLRRGEIAVGHSRDVLVSAEGPSLVVHGKGGKTRVVPLTDDLAHELLSLPEGYFFPGKINGHLSARRISELAKDRLPNPWTIHKLRHMFASRSFAVSKDIVAVQTMLGHASIATTRDYVAVDKQELRSIVNEVAIRSLDEANDRWIRENPTNVVTIDIDTVSKNEAARIISILSQKLLASTG
ncbi:site-specific integrase [Leucobacter aridicollis]|uniref:site-specific integrase n=1 Tax=Leucobacter aridicollis TaxID=283878 RepID=UPI002105D499|nr:tyrosine-type recombinase/integrase [Leucobacter aridicollis]